MFIRKQYHNNVSARCIAMSYSTVHEITRSSWCYGASQIKSSWEFRFCFNSPQDLYFFFSIAMPPSSPTPSPSSSSSSCRPWSPPTAGLIPCFLPQCQPQGFGDPRGNPRPSVVYHASLLWGRDNGRRRQLSFQMLSPGYINHTIHYSTIVSLLTLTQWNAACNDALSVPAISKYSYRGTVIWDVHSPMQINVIYSNMGYCNTTSVYSTKNCWYTSDVKM